MFLETDDDLCLGTSVRLTLAACTHVCTCAVLLRYCFTGVSLVTSEPRRLPFSAFPVLGFQVHATMLGLCIYSIYVRVYQGVYMLGEGSMSPELSARRMPGSRELHALSTKTVAVFSMETSPQLLVWWGFCTLRSSHLHSQALCQLSWRPALLASVFIYLVCS